MKATSIYRLYSLRALLLVYARANAHEDECSEAGRPTDWAK